MACRHELDMKPTHLHEDQDYTALDKCCRDTSVSSKWRAGGPGVSLVLLKVRSSDLRDEKDRSNACGGRRIQIYKQLEYPRRTEF